MQLLVRKERVSARPREQKTVEMGRPALVGSSRNEHRTSDKMPVMSQGKDGGKFLKEKSPFKERLVLEEADEVAGEEDGEEDEMNWRSRNMWLSESNGRTT